MAQLGRPAHLPGPRRAVRYPEWPRTIGVMIVTLMLVAALVAPSFGGPGGCPDVSIVGVRGSGQDGYGEQVGAVVAELTASMTATGRTVSDVPLEYPAISVSDTFGLALFDGRYEASVRSGVDALTSLLSDLTDRCAGSDLILVGYSQGAQVIKATVAGSSPDMRIAGVVLLADPTRDPSQPGVARLGGAAVEHAGSFGRVALPGYLRPVTVDVCVAGDVVCAPGSFAFGAHVYGYGEHTAAAAARVASFVLTDQYTARGIR